MDIKKPTTYDEQVRIILQKGFVIDDATSCIEFLKRVNYYRIKAYFLPFRNSQGIYSQGIRFERIRNIYNFDSELRALLFKAIERIECYVRAQLAYYMANKYGALSYLDESCFNTRHVHTDFLEKISQCIKEHIRSAVVRHHNKKYDGKFPFWVVIEFFSMGMLSYFYSDLKASDQKAIAKNAFGAAPVCVKSWLRCVTDLRNRCAHYSRLYYWIFSAIPQFPKKSIYTADRKLFSQILMLKYMYPDKNEWNGSVVCSLSALLEHYGNDISLTHIGFPLNWEEILRKN